MRLALALSLVLTAVMVVGFVVWWPIGLAAASVGYLGCTRQLAGIWAWEDQGYALRRASNGNLLFGVIVALFCSVIWPISWPVAAMTEIHNESMDRTGGSDVSRVWYTPPRHKRQLQARRIEYLENQLEIAKRS